MPAPKGNKYAKGHGQGRPSEYDPKYADMLIQDMADGYTLTAFAGSIRVSRETVYRWLEQFQDFRDAFKKGQAGRQRYWETTLKDKEGNAAKSIFGLKNCAPDDFKDKQELGFTDQAGNDAQIIVSLGAQIAQSMRKKP